MKEIVPKRDLIEVACENIRFSSLFVAKDVSREGNETRGETDVFAGYDRGWSSSGTKLAAASCEQAENDDERCQNFAQVFFQHLHKSFGNIDATTFFKPPDLPNRQILKPICGYGKETFLQI